MLAVASSVVAALAVGPVGSAAADPATPSQSQVDAARAAASSAAGQVAAVQAQLDAASAALQAAQTTAEQAAEAYDGATEALAARTSAASQAQAAAASARASAQGAKAQVGRLVAGTYRSGGDLSDLTAFLSADGPQDLLDRAALLDAVSSSQERTYQRMDSAEGVADLLQAQARQAQAQEQVAADAADAARQRAQSTADGAQSLVTATAAHQAQLTAELAQLQHVSTTLEAQRQAGLARQAQEQAEAAARAARLAQASREAAAARARAHASTAGSSGSSTSGSAGSSSGGSSWSGDDSGGSGDDSGSGSSSGSASEGASAVAWAQAQIGDPYVWGATGPGAFDCSGLTSQAWLHAGVVLPRTSAEQYLAVEKISYSDLRPGDLIFYATDTDDPSTIHHVAMYAGGGMMVEAPHTGADVREVPVRYDGSMDWAGRP